MHLGGGGRRLCSLEPPPPPRLAGALEASRSGSAERPKGPAQPLLHPFHQWPLQASRKPQAGRHRPIRVLGKFQGRAWSCWVLNGLVQGALDTAVVCEGLSSFLALGPRHAHAPPASCAETPGGPACACSQGSRLWPPGWRTGRSGASRGKGSPGVSSESERAGRLGTEQGGRFAPEPVLEFAVPASARPPAFQAAQRPAPLAAPQSPRVSPRPVHTHTWAPALTGRVPQGQDARSLLPGAGSSRTAPPSTRKSPSPISSGSGSLPFSAASMSPG